MSQNIPLCPDFVIAAIRKLRRNPANVTANTNAGMSLSRLWAIVKELYSEEDFRQGLEKLLAENAILITARRHRGVAMSSSEVTITKIPKELGDCRVWHLTESGEYQDVPESSESQCHFVRRMLIYVRSDGLPKKAQRIQGTICKSSVAQSIIDEMN